jgi:hypothetical protein
MPFKAMIVSSIPLFALDSNPPSQKPKIENPHSLQQAGEVDNKPVKERKFTLTREFPTGEIISYVSTGKFPGMLFRSGYFGMPIVVGPYSSSDSTMRLIFQNTLFEFQKKDFGFVLTRKLELPKHPSEPEINRLEDRTTSEFWTTEALIQTALTSNPTIGFQLNELGDVFWIGSTSIQKFDNGTWTPILNFDKEFISRKCQAKHYAGAIVLPNNRVALIGGRDYFIKIVEPNPSGNEINTIKTFGYDALGCEATNFPDSTGPQFAISSDSLYFHLRTTGHIFRLELDNFHLADLDAPWVQFEFVKPGQPLKWKNTNGSSMTSEPVVPESISFAIDWDGSVHATALFYNSPDGALAKFSLDTLTSTIKPEYVQASSNQDPNVYQNSKGDLVPLRGATIAPSTSNINQ